jgi:aryl-alcohol dehydrogenase-like predicted oxidoreductase
MRAPLEPLFAVMEPIAQDREASIAQVALNWLRASDPLVIPIPGVKNACQARENAAALRWRLSEEEFQRISRAEIAARG